MGVRVQEIITAHPDTEPGQVLLEGRLKELRARFEVVAAAQRAGLIDVHSGAEEKRRLRREMLAGPIAHLADIGQLASRERHDLPNGFRFKPSADTYVAFRSAARSMQEAALSHKELLLKYGGSESVMELFGQLLDQFDAATSLGSQGRAAHTAATSELTLLAAEIVQVARAMVCGAGCGSGMTGNCSGPGSTPARCSGRSGRWQELRRCLAAGRTRERRRVGPRRAGT